MICKMKKKFFLVASLFFVYLFFVSCNVTRTVTTRAESYIKGDTAVHVTTRTVESYDGAIKR